jgi:hypothetical protein
VQNDWYVTPWLFVPIELRSPLDQTLHKIANIGIGAGQRPFPQITDLEEVTPWKYKSWNRYEELATKHGD